MTTKLEERTTQAYQTDALDEVKTEYSKYFEALEKHPRLLVGQTVPAVGREGDETLRTSDDAKEWQEAVKSVLVDEVRSRASKAMDDNADFLTTVHASIEIFSKNPDLIPGTKEFDVDLANRFVTLAAPYELQHEGKLQGYSIPVQPIIEQLRTQLVTERAKAPAASAAPAAAAGSPAAGAAPATPQTPAAAAGAPAEPPQAGIPAKAGNSGEGEEDFSTLFGTIGLPDFRI